MTWAGFDADKFTITQGQPANYKSSPGVLRTFCGACGTALTYQRADLPESIDVTLGSMDDPQILEPQDHTWTESRIGWIAVNHGLPEYPRERKLLPSS